VLVANQVALAVTNLAVVVAAWSLVVRFVAPAASNASNCGGWRWRQGWWRW
jgi:hypothetical protein